MSQYHKVATAQGIQPGASVIVEIEGQDIAIFRLNDQYYAIQNHCPHRQGPLGEGLVAGNTVTCPWHGWQFDVTTGKSTTGSPVVLKTYPVKVENNEVKVFV